MAQNVLELPVNIRLTAGEVNYVLNVLQRQPWGDVDQLIRSIKAQGDQQIFAQTRPAEAPHTADKSEEEKSDG